MSDDEKTKDPRKVGDIADALGVELNLYEDDMVTDVLVLAKVVEADGSVRLSYCASDGMSWIERIGLLSAATKMAMP